MRLHNLAKLNREKAQKDQLKKKTITNYPNVNLDD